jgi:uncharacterized protein (TIGR00369 family)
LSFQTQDPRYSERVRESFARQRVMLLIGASVTRIEPGAVDIELPFRDDLTQQHGYIHAGIVASIVDSACGYAALTLMPAGSGVLAVEFKVNFLAPARGARLVAEGRVTRAGRNITVCAGDVLADQDGRRKQIATMLSTVMAIHDRAGVQD